MSDLIGQVNNRIYIKRWKRFALPTVKFTGIKVTHNSSAPFDLNSTSLRMRIYSVTPFHYVSTCSSWIRTVPLFQDFLNTRLHCFQTCWLDDHSKFKFWILSFSYDFGWFKKNTIWQALDYFNWQRNHSLTCSVSRPFSSVGFPSVIRIIRGQSFLPFTLTTPPKIWRKQLELVK